MKAIVPVDCPSGSQAFLCQDVRLRMAFRLRDGAMGGRASVREIWTCADPACATITIQHRWRGRVTRADGRFDDVVGASVSGHGTATVVASTFEFLAFHETVVIREHDDDAD